MQSIFEHLATAKLAAHSIASFLLRLRQQTLQRSCNASEIGGEKRACDAGEAAQNQPNLRGQTRQNFIYCLN